CSAKASWWEKRGCTASKVRQLMKELWAGACCSFKNWLKIKQWHFGWGKAQNFNWRLDSASAFHVSRQDFGTVMHNGSLHLLQQMLILLAIAFPTMLICSNSPLIHPFPLQERLVCSHNLEEKLLIYPNSRLEEVVILGKDFAATYLEPSNCLSQESYKPWMINQTRQ
ncbi:hypothetical protein Prudu_012024, partial [Prunus dulcis]